MVLFQNLALKWSLLPYETALKWSFLRMFAQIARNPYATSNREAIKAKPRAEMVLIRALKWSFTLPLNLTSKKPIGKKKQSALKIKGNRMDKPCELRSILLKRLRLRGNRKRNPIRFELVTDGLEASNATW